MTLDFDHLLAAALAVFVGFTGLAQAQIQENWENRRVLETLNKMTSAEDQTGAKRLELHQQRDQARAQAVVLQSEAKRAATASKQACADGAGRDCMDASAVSQEAHMAFTVNIGQRLEVNLDLVGANIRYGIKMADLLTKVVGDLNRHRAKETRASQPAVDALEARANAFLDKAMTALRRTADYNAKVAVSVGNDSPFAKAKTRAQRVAARDTLKAIDRFGKQYGAGAKGGVPKGRLEVLQTKFVAFTAINRQARGAYLASVGQLRGLNAAAAASLAEDMIGTFDGGIGEYSRRTVKQLTEDLDDIYADMALIGEAVGGEPESAGESMFDDDDGFMD